MDPIANMISSIKNTISTKKEYLLVSFSNIKLKILETLKQNGYIDNYKIVESSYNKKNIKIILKYQNNKNKISHIKRISRPSLRVYISYKQIPLVLDGLGDVIISTPKGVMSGKQARKQKAGGEIICEVF